MAKYVISMIFALNTLLVLIMYRKAYDNFEQFIGMFLGY